MSLQPDVSIVVAAWKSADFIAPTLLGALRQEGCTVEVIVVDDASPDDTRSVVRRIGDPRLVYDRLPVNGGPSAARNRGFALARGRWIAVLDSDDAMEPGRLARMLAVADRARADVVVDNLRVVTDAADPGRPMFPASLLSAMPRLTLDTFIRSNRLFVSTFNFGYMKPMFRTRFVRDHGITYDVSLRLGEDYVFLADCLARGAVCAVDPEPGYRYLVRPGSISRLTTSDDIRAMRRADEAFVARNRLDPPARKAQAERDASLSDGLAFTGFVEALKARRIVAAIAHLARRPAAIRHLRMPIGARIERLRARLLPSSPGHSAAASERGV
jgi:succinoglycan biosynthesis protein ExoO